MLSRKSTMPSRPEIVSPVKSRAKIGRSRKSVTENVQVHVASKIMKSRTKVAPSTNKASTMIKLILKDETSDKVSHVNATLTDGLGTSFK